MSESHMRSDRPTRISESYGRTDGRTDEEATHLPAETSPYVTRTRAYGDFTADRPKRPSRPSCVEHPGQPINCPRCLEAARRADHKAGAAAVRAALRSTKETR